MGISCKLYSKTSHLILLAPKGSWDSRWVIVKDTPVAIDDDFKGNGITTDEGIKIQVLNGNIWFNATALPDNIVKIRLVQVDEARLKAEILIKYDLLNPEWAYEIYRCPPDSKGRYTTGKVCKRFRPDADGTIDYIIQELTASYSVAPKWVKKFKRCGAIVSDSEIKI